MEITQKVTGCRDPKDDRFLELAVNGQAEVIISGDQDLLMLHPYGKVVIVTPQEFIRYVEEAG